MNNKSHTNPCKLAGFIDSGKNQLAAVKNRNAGNIFNHGG
jgi:hypothetical protein